MRLRLAAAEFPLNITVQSVNTSCESGLIFFLFFFFDW